MENTTNNSFEEQWQRAFDDASLSPSEAVWEKIESELQNNIPPKPNNNSYYYFGTISAVIIGVSLWLFMNKKGVVKPLQIVENKKVISKIKVENLLPKEERNTIEVKERTAIKKTFILEKKKSIEPESITQIVENQERIITDSIDFMSPITVTKKVNSEFDNSSINIPQEKIPYYEISKPKSKKKSIWDKVRISGGVGVY